MQLYDEYGRPVQMPSHDQFGRPIAQTYGQSHSPMTPPQHGHTAEHNPGFRRPEERYMSHPGYQQPQRNPGAEPVATYSAAEERYLNSGQAQMQYSHHAQPPQQPKEIIKEVVVSKPYYGKPIGRHNIFGGDEQLVYKVSKMNVKTNGNAALVDRLCFNKNNHSILCTETKNKLEEVLVRRKEMDISDHVEENQLVHLLRNNGPITKGQLVDKIENQSIMSSEKEVVVSEHISDGDRATGISLLAATVFGKKNINVNVLKYETIVPIRANVETEKLIPLLNTAVEDFNLSDWLKDAAKFVKLYGEVEKPLCTKLRTRLTDWSNGVTKHRISTNGLAIDDFFDDYTDLMEELRNSGLTEKYEQALTASVKTLFPIEIAAVGNDDEDSNVCIITDTEVVISTDLDGDYTRGSIISDLTPELYQTLYAVSILGEDKMRPVTANTFTGKFQKEYYTVVTTTQALKVVSTGSISPIFSIVDVTYL